MNVLKQTRRVDAAVERGRAVAERAVRVLPPDRAAGLLEDLDLLADAARRQLERDAQWLGERARQ